MGLTNMEKRMTKEEMIELAKQAGLDPDLWNYTDAFETFAKLVAKRTWVGLTEDEVNDLYNEGMGINATIEATEARLRSKNT
jgi:hypothetical protein